MSDFQINNPVYKDLIDLNLIDANEIKIFHKKTRDGKFKVLIDPSSELIFLEKFSLKDDYYFDSPGAANFDSFFKKNGYFVDDLRRFEFLKDQINRAGH